MSIRHGKPVSVKEIVSTDTGGAGQSEVAGEGREGCALGDSVRTVGRLKTVLSVETVVVEDEGCELEVDVALSNPCHFKPGRQYQFIGELEDRRNSLGSEANTLILVARIARDVTGLDMDLYRRGLEAQEQCLREFERNSPGAS
ncbi:CST complex subunit TEN1-like [Chloropicon primus]|uniref:Uncharacterized protein n=1 Tax=Chloropicon primus TaxID=1764295 RepID=A0A5B8MKP9_9CHLO|nr:hypothetical protein A3770_05p35640 [Chloropicon primus]UPR00257.1 CST complex subunit TEN1-like [Chloropicon primus]|mmetsp:Transcript_184/g.454  ORF Transcript_184/g.454 Transcript_184/m.454 type:complete len:144 (-) Transcript_184:80-511(-)|eukprot:QDZ21046.1 hypothetical protein A3770_05p35640 [Chloropicon primus]